MKKSFKYILLIALSLGFSGCDISLSYFKSVKDDSTPKNYSVDYSEDVAMFRGDQYEPLGGSVTLVPLITTANFFGACPMPNKSLTYRYSGPAEGNVCNFPTLDSGEIELLKALYCQIAGERGTDIHLELADKASCYGD